MKRKKKHDVQIKGVSCITLTADLHCLSFLCTFLFYFSLSVLPHPALSLTLPNSSTGPQIQPHICSVAVFSSLALCPGPSLVTPVISWARSTGATSACVRQGLCVVAWYSPFSWLGGNNPHYNTPRAFLTHARTRTHTICFLHIGMHAQTYTQTRVHPCYPDLRL